MALFFTTRIHRYLCGLWHIRHQLGHSDLPSNLHGIQCQSADPQPNLGQYGLQGDTGFIRGASGGEIQLPHPGGKRLWEHLHGECHGRKKKRKRVFELLLCLWRGVNGKWEF